MALKNRKNSSLSSGRWRVILNRVLRLGFRGSFYSTIDDPDSVRRIEAYRFKSELNPSQMQSVLNEAGPWRWVDRDTAWYKDDISSTVSDHAIVRIYNEGNHYNLSFFFKSVAAEAKKEWNEIHQIIQNQIFPAIQASDIGYDSPNDPPAGWWRAPTRDEDCENEDSSSEKDNSTPERPEADDVSSKHTCAVCGLHPGEVLPSSLGPTSYAVCETCIEENAESIGVACLWIRLQGGPEKVEKGDPVGRHLELKSFSDGHYIGWPEIVRIYPQYEAMFSKNQG